jgi:hypothetical protein
MSYFKSEKQREDLRQEYVNELRSLNPNEIVHECGVWLINRKKYTALDMINEMMNQTKLSNKILEELQEERLFD